MTRTVADFITETLQQAGVKRVFGVVGDSLNGFTDALRRQEQIEWIHMRNEESAAFAAGAEAHLTGELAVCAGKSVLNLFAYTCGVGLSAAAGGAREVCNLDFAEGNLAVGRENGLLNPQLPTMEFVQSDYFPAIRQLAGLPITQRRGQKLPSYPRLEQRQYDLVLLDPPAWAKSAFGTVDLLRDYQSLLKPALLATADNGVLICCNNLAKVSMDDWREQVLRCAEKAGRPVRDWQIMTPGADFPSQDQQPPLKTLILQL